MEALGADGTIKPTGGTIARFEPPTGLGIRVDTFGYGGYTTSPRYDSLLAKVICFSDVPQLPTVLNKCRRALRTFRVEGIETNKALLAAILDLPALQSWDVYTALVNEQLPFLGGQLTHYRELASTDNQAKSDNFRPSAPLPASLTPVTSPLHGTLVRLQVKDGDEVHAGQEIAIVCQRKQISCLRTSQTFRGYLVNIAGG